MKAKEYRDAVNSGKMKAPKPNEKMNAWGKWAYAMGWTTSAGGYRTYMNGGSGN